MSNVGSLASCKPGSLIMAYVGSEDIATTKDQRETIHVTALCFNHSILPLPRVIQPFGHVQKGDVLHVRSAAPVTEPLGVMTGK